MESNDFDEFVVHARRVFTQLRETYKEVVGEELDLEAAIRHYPLVAVTVALGVGALGGWWVGRKLRPEPQALPPPRSVPAPSPQSRLDRTIRSAHDLSEKLKERRNDAPEGSPPRALDYLGAMLPEGAAEEAAARAREWADTRLEPALQKGLERAASSKFGAMVRESLHRLEKTQSGDTEQSDPADEPEEKV
jgi:hypothetical protein